MSTLRLFLIAVALISSDYSFTSYKDARLAQQQCRVQRDMPHFGVSIGIDYKREKTEYAPKRRHHHFVRRPS